MLGEGNRSVTQSRSGEVTNESDGGLVLGDVAENEPQEILDEDTGDNVTAPVVSPIAGKNEPPRGLTAALGMAWGEITGSFLWSVLVILCLMILAFFTRRKLLKSREK